MKSEIWYKIECPQCKKTNWFYDGSMEDDDVNSCIEAFECGNCGHLWDSGDWIDVLYGGMPLEDVVKEYAISIATGKRRPK